MPEELREPDEYVYLERREFVKVQQCKLGVTFKMEIYQCRGQADEFGDTIACPFVVRKIFFNARSTLNPTRTKKSGEFTSEMNNQRHNHPDQAEDPEVILRGFDSFFRREDRIP